MTKKHATYDSRFWIGLAGWLPLSLIGCASAMAVSQVDPAASLQTGLCSISTAEAVPGAPRYDAIDLGDWQQGGRARSGNWSIDPGGQSVLQALNGAPTSFHSARKFIDVTIAGTFEVFDASDDDFIGFVFGYEAHGGDESRADFLLFDWRGGEQSSAAEGFTLSRVAGPMSNSAGIGTPWWGHTHPSIDVLATDLGAGKGWRHGRKHEFELSYLKDRIRIVIDGLQVFDLPGEFESGQFGFYNFSQARTRYSLLGASPAGARMGVATLR
ncbi:MAG: hypothetical protein ACI8QZ_001148 [Chlamydiales bacterium]|jgi:hypothetical protein